jgi:hypothetical protein
VKVARWTALRTLLLVCCVIALAPLSTFATNILFSGNGSSGDGLGVQNAFAYWNASSFNWQTGFFYNWDTWTEPTATAFEITFDLPPGAFIDPNSVANGTCGSNGPIGTAFCQGYQGWSPWTADLISPDTIKFSATQNHALFPNPFDLYDEGFSINVDFDGSTVIPSFTGFWTVTPEPSSLLLFSTGLLGFCFFVRRQI